MNHSGKNEFKVTETVRELTDSERRIKSRQIVAALKALARAN